MTTSPITNALFTNLNLSFSERANDIALICNEEKILYRQLDCASHHLAKQLKEKAISENLSVIPVLAERSVEFIVVALACWKAGVGYLPISVDSPLSRIRLILDDIDCPFFLTAGCKQVPEQLEQFVFHWELNLSPTETTAMQPVDGQIAYLIYTSGTTGKPKGCEIGFESFAPITEQVKNTYEISRDSRVTAVANCAFDASAFEIWPALSAGATLHIVGNDILVNPTRLVDYFCAHEITYSWLPTPIIEVMMQDPSLHLPDTLKTLVTAGQRLTVRPPGHWSVRLFNAYGPTETTIIATSSSVSSEGKGLPDIGKPLPGVNTYILDAQLSPVKTGEVGELFIGGIGVGRGYFNREDLTKDKFITLEKAGQQVDFVYATGDLCVENQDGNLEFIERKDQQIKRNGYRIETGEIEYRLGQFSNVKQAAVKLHRLGARDVLAAHYVSEDGNKIDENTVIDFLKATLPDYMVPDIFVDIESLPLTINGKVDKNSLKLNEIHPVTTNNSDHSNEEARFLSIFNQLSTQPIEWQDDCFSKGLNSIAIIQILQRIQKAFGFRLAFEDIFKHKTPSNIWYSTQGRSEKQVEIVPRSNEFRDTAPLSSTQRSIWYITTISPEDRAYHAKSVLHFTGNLNLHLLQDALQDVVNQNEIFRTTFDRKQPVQRIHDYYKVQLSLFDYSGLPFCEAREKSDILVAETLNISFDIEKLPLVRWACVKLSENKYELIHIEHHLVHDGWSYNIFLKELFESYRQRAEGKSSIRYEGILQYADYSVTQQNWLKSPSANEQMHYWVDQLANAPVSINLPDTSTRDKSTAGRSLRTTISRQTWDSIEKYCKQHSVTPFSFMLAAVNVTLMHYTGDEDICVGVGLANRNWVNSEKVIGMLVNTIVTRVKQAPEMTIQELIVQCFQVIMSGQENQEYPFELLVEHINPVRPDGRNPIFQVCLGFHDSPLPDMTLPEIESIWLQEAIGSESAKFDLSLVLIPRKGQNEDDDLTLIWEYNLALLGPWFVENMRITFDALIEQMLRLDGQTRLSELTLYPCKAHDGVGDLVSGKRKTVSEETLVSLFESQVSATPGHTAIVYDDQIVSYDELNKRANKLAHEIRALYQAIYQKPMDEDTLIGLYLDRGVDMVVAMLAVMKAGAAYVPVAPKYPDERACYILNDCQSPLLLTQEKYVQTIRDWRGALRLDPVCIVVDQQDSVANHADSNAVLKINPSALAYVIFTSGTTGRPKGVLVQHDNVVAMIQSSCFRAHPEKGALWTDYVFDVSVYEIFSSLLSGGELHIVPETLRFAPETYLAFIDEKRIARCYMPPSYIKTMTEAVCREQVQSLKWVLTGVEKIPMAYVRDLATKDIVLVNGYGPTETTICSTAVQLSKEILRYNAIPIGRPNENEQCYVLNQQRKLCPPGVPGELYIGGSGVARGYLNLQEETADRFINNPFASDEDIEKGFTRLYRTGDRARWLDDGNLEFLGRNDSQVKIRGFRIELSEIEQAAADIEGIKSAVVVDFEQNNQSYLAAYLVCEEAQSVELAMVEQCLRKKLPDYMIPHSFMCVDTIPLTNNGKLDRSALPIPTLASIEQAAPPETYEELLFAKLWGELLGIDWHRISKKDTFFGLGGHSLLIIQLKAKLFMQGYDLPADSLYGSLSLEDMVQVAEFGDQEQAPLPLVPTDARCLTPEMFSMLELSAASLSQIIEQVSGGVENIQDIYPLSSIQQGLLFHALSSADNDPYVIKTVFAGDSLKWCAKLVKGLRFLVERHDILRTRFIYAGLAEPVQVVCRNAVLQLNKISIDSALTETEAEKWINDFDLGRGDRISLESCPLFNVTLVSHRDKHYVVTFHHHLIIDDLSQRIFQEELKAFIFGGRSRLPSPVPYRDFIWHLQQENRETALAYFEDKLSDYQQLTHPFLVQTVDVDKELSNSFSMRLTGDVPLRIKVLAKKHGCSIPVILHLAWSLVLSKCSAQSDVVFGTVLSGRMRSVNNIERVVGPCINTLPIRVNFAECNVSALLQDVQDSLANLLLFEQTPLAEVQKLSAVEPDTPLFNTVLNCRMLMNKDDKGMASQDAFRGIRPLSGKGGIHYPIFITINTGDDAFLFNIDSHVNIKPARLYEYMLTALEAILAASDNDDDSYLANVELLSKEERLQLDSWNQTGNAVPSQTLVSLFERQVAATPNQAALDSEGGRISYDELNRRANRLAREIRKQYRDTYKKELSPDTLVGLYLDRGIDMVAAMLAVMKAGAAYVPIAPKYPDDRACFMLNDSQSPLLLTQSHYRAKVEAWQPSLKLDTLVIAVDQSDIALEQQSTNLDVLACVSDLAYVIYTSGTSGRPKGVLVQQDNIIAHLHSTLLKAEPSKSSVWTDYVFDISAYEIYSTLLCGGELHIVPEKLRFSPDAYLKFIQEKCIARCYMPPGYVKAMTEAVCRNQIPTLKWVLTGVEKIPTDYVRDLVSRDITLINGYGPTETTTGSTTTQFNQSLCHYSSIPIGRPNDNEQCYVLDEQMMLCPLGVPGELYIGGAGVTRGYLNLPRETDERFVTNPFASQHDVAKGYTRLYRTGDKVRWLPDGNLEFLGRYDSQVKIRGFRIELSEIESALTEMKEVKSAIVVDFKRNEHSYLAAYLVCSGAGEVDIKKIEQHLRNILPDYMIPQSFMCIDAVPLTNNGKLDNSRLPEPEITSQCSFEAPRNDTEEKICRIWQDVLSHKKVGINDNFFQLGGNSLNAVTIASLCKDKLGLEIPLGALLKQGTIKRLIDVTGITYANELSVPNGVDGIAQQKIRKTTWI